MRSSSGSGGGRGGEGGGGGATTADYLLAAFYLFALWGNVSVDVFMGLDIDLQSTGFAFHKEVYRAGQAYDPLFLDNAGYMRASALVTALFYAPYYVMAVPPLLRGQGLGNFGSLLRKYAWTFAVGMLGNMTIVLLLELREAVAGSELAPSIGYYWIPCGLYWVVPLCVLVRLVTESRQGQKQQGHDD